MADATRDPGTGGDTRNEPDLVGAPRWVKVSTAVAVVLVLVIVLMMLFGGGRHGPGRHLRSGNPAGTPSGAGQR